MQYLRCFVILLTLGIGACNRDTGVDPHVDSAYPTKLSEWRLFTATKPLKLNAGVVHYDLNTTLFSDYADKSRTLWMPPGQAAAYRANDVFEFPVGTIFTKTFSFPRKDGTERMIETRVLVRRNSGWAALPYVWNREQTEAELDTAAIPQRVTRVDANGHEQTFDYEIPTTNQCAACHVDGQPLGLKARHLNRDGQLARWVKAGLLKGAPEPAAIPRAAVWDDPRTGSLDQRAEAYLDVNCVHCHREGTRGGRLDACKGPEMVHRMESLDPEKKMPSLGHDLVHREGVELIREWVAAHPTKCS